MPEANETPKRMTCFETFKIIKGHLLKQKRRSRIFIPRLSQTMCAYRGANGTKCGVGVLIPDDRYNPDFEGRSVYDLFGERFAEDCNIPHNKKVEQFLTDIQQLHDCIDPTFWESKLNEIEQRVIEGTFEYQF